MRILVVPENLHSLSVQLQQVAGDLQGVESRVSGALGGLDWEARHKVGIEGQVGHARNQARALAARAEEMGRYLASKAQAFEEADGQGVGGVGQVAASFSDWQRGWAQGPYSHWRFPGQTVNAVWNLGGVSAQLPQISPTVLPVAGGATVVGLAALTPLSGILSPLKDFGEQVWNWLHGYGWKSNADLVVPVHTETTREPVVSRFGALLESESEAGAETALETRPVTVSESKPKTQSVKDQWWIDVPLKSQQGLKYGKQKTAYGCVPTATSMILDYWHAKDPANKTDSAQELLDINAGQGVFGPKGMSAANILDEVSKLGYGVADVRADSDPDALKEAVSKGPVLAIVKLGMKARGTTHAVVVTGISPDGKEVRVNDPWDGQSHVYSWEQFSRSWGADFGKDKQGNDYPKNNFVVIRPS